MARMTQSMADQVTLAMIQIPHPSQFRFERLELMRAAFDVLVQGRNRPPNGLRVVHQEIGQVILIGFRVEERPAVLDRRLQDYFRYRDKFTKPISSVKH